jgi:CheY-like chemotaxis protein
MFSRLRLLKTEDHELRELGLPAHLLRRTVLTKSLGEPPAVTVGPRHERMRVLIVDEYRDRDGASMLSLCIDLLADYDQRVVRGGLEALDLARSYQPDVILFDVDRTFAVQRLYDRHESSPGARADFSAASFHFHEFLRLQDRFTDTPFVNLRELAQRFRVQLNLSAAVLIAITAYDDEPDRQMCRKAGFDFCLVKPYDLNDLMAILARKATAPVPLLRQSA